jgi:PhzF family phenazine biosynthesis protein
MQRIAADVGFSETAFVAPRDGSVRSVRYFSPGTEVPFCGHATIATGAVLGEQGDGTFVLQTRAGDVPVEVRSGGTEISLISVVPRQKALADALLDEILTMLRWGRSDLDARIPPVVAWAGAWHPVIAVTTAGRLADLDYDFGALRRLMQREDYATLQLVWRESDELFHARNPFPVGGVVEDPATGAAAAALAGYLRDAGLLSAPAKFTIRQGEAMGRPSVLRVDVPVAGGIRISGAVAAIENA